MPLRSPIWWFGGKGNLSSWIVPVLEGIPHSIYVEPFGGGASVLMRKKPVSVEVYNDIDAGLHDFFMVLSDQDDFEAFYRRVSVLPFSRRLYCESRSSWMNEPDRIKRVAMWFVVARQSLAGAFGVGWGLVVKKSSRGMAGSCSAWLSCIDALPCVHSRLQRVQIENNDFRRVIDTYDTPDTLFYLDPPYIASTRKSGKYSHELTDSDHVDLVDMLLGIQGNAVLSGYLNNVYDCLIDAGWGCVKREVSCHAAPKTRASGLQGKGAIKAKQPRTECLWIKPYQSKQMEIGDNATT